MKTANFKRYPGSGTLFCYYGFELSYNPNAKKNWNLTVCFHRKPTDLKDGQENFEAFSLFEINSYFEKVYNKTINVEEIQNRLEIPKGF